ncbi:hypothetical protein B0A54_05749 [Friedmanniomyces endolithicus]|uniref:AAA+ ATPase domain-containing protein n=1 Tax=Friedmanniomyces endolithicus TaxID=329885 RepID=A0A4U0V3M4_9PEZI|nr:hypothetical protein B0A54_05749 [Friedmanniomyces endolithicus]
MPQTGHLLGLRPLGGLFTVLMKKSDAIAASSPETILARFFEMLEGTSTATRVTFTLVTPLVMLGMVLAKHKYLVSALSGVEKMILSSVTSQITIDAGHPLQRQVMAWLVQHGLKNTNRLAIAPPLSARILKDDTASRNGIKSAEAADLEEKAKLIYVPDVGSYDFNFGGYRMRFEKSTVTKEASGAAPTQFPGEAAPEPSLPRKLDTIVLSCLSFWAGTKPLKLFLEHVRNANHTSDEAQTRIFRPNRDGWDLGVLKPRRTLDAVTLDAHIKDPLVKDIRDYLDPRTKQFYIRNGIPYRKGYLMYGPPGTGKTSFAAALAGEFNLNVYVCSISDRRMTDRMLEETFAQLPPSCVVLMEDIDCAGIKRETVPVAPKPSKSNKDPFKDPEPITLSGLLNVIDGVGASEGRILLMTSNAPDALDRALVRPGRIDKKILFGYASRSVAAMMFTRIFSQPAEQVLDGEAAAAPFEDVPRLAREFAEQIPAGAITPAEIQGHLLSNRTDPVVAVAAAAAFVADTLDAKRNGTNVANFEAKLGPRAPVREKEDEKKDEKEDKKVDKKGDEKADEKEDEDVD